MEINKQMTQTHFGVPSRFVLSSPTHAAFLGNGQGTGVPAYERDFASSTTRVNASAVGSIQLEPPI